MADQPNSRPITRYLARCLTCRAWWSVLPPSNGSAGSCPCGGRLALVDMDAHRKYLPMAAPISNTPKEK